MQGSDRTKLLYPRSFHCDETPERKLEEKGLILDHGLGGFGLSLCSLADRGKAASLKKCG